MTACRTISGTKPYSTPGWENHRLPNAPRPYAKLFVEIDAVEGCEPRPAELVELKEFLEQWTHKPGGVTVKLDTIIAAEKARGRAPDSLALEYSDGPPDEETAFLYVFCYRGRRNPFSSDPENPHFTLYPYPCAIFLNRSYAFGWFSWVGRARQLMMRHEIGHALGLATNAAHSRRGHCTNPGCLMRAGIRFNVLRLLTFRAPFDTTEFCGDCRRDLELYRTADAPPGTRFWRGYFVRSGEGYHVLTRPGMVYVHFGDFDRLDANRLEAFRHEAIGDLTARGDRKYKAHGDLDATAVGVQRFVERETEIEGLRRLAESLLTSCLAQAQAASERDPAQAREILRLALPAAALKFPELHAKLQALHDRITAASQNPTEDDRAER